MQAKHLIAGRALKLMFIGQLLVLIATAMGIIPVISALSGIVSIVGSVIALVGLIQAGPAHGGYGKAIAMLVLGVVVGVISSFVVAGGVLGGSAGIVMVGAVMAVAVSIFGLLQVYFVCNASSTLLREAGSEATAAKGDTVWKINAVCYLAVIVLTLIGMFSTAIAGVGSIIIGIVSIVGTILYVIFLKEGSEALSASGNAQQ